MSFYFVIVASPTRGLEEDWNHILLAPGLHSVFVLIRQTS